MNLKERLQRMLQIVADAEQSGAMSALEQDIILAELREAYAELRFGTENEESREAIEDNLSTLNSPFSTEDDDEPEVEVELIFNEEEDDEEETENGELKTENGEISEELVESSEKLEDNLSTLNSELSTAEEDNLSTLNSELSTAEDEYLSTLNSQLSTPKRSALLSLYDDEPAPVVGEQFREAPSVADTIARPKGVAENAPIASLREAIGVADRYMLIRELFDGDDAAYEFAVSVLDAQPSFEDCLIYISEHYAWRPNNEGTKTLMSLIQRKFN